MHTHTHIIHLNLPDKLRVTGTKLYVTVLTMLVVPVRFGLFQKGALRDNKESWN